LNLNLALRRDSGCQYQCQLLPVRPDDTIIMMKLSP
jgi:hypothetical protein